MKLNPFLQKLSPLQKKHIYQSPSFSQEKLFFQRAEKNKAIAIVGTDSSATRGTEISHSTLFT